MLDWGRRVCQSWANVMQQGEHGMQCRAYPMTSFAACAPCTRALMPAAPAVASPDRFVERRSITYVLLCRCRSRSSPGGHCRARSWTSAGPQVWLRNQGRAAQPAL